MVDASREMQQLAAAHDSRTWYESLNEPAEHAVYEDDSNDRGFASL